MNNENPEWTAKIPPDEMAVVMCDDLCKKLNILQGIPKDRAEQILAGLSDGLIGNDEPHPLGSLSLPPVRRSMDPGYCAGFGVGETWARIAREWPTRDTNATHPTFPNPSKP